MSKSDLLTLGTKCPAHSRRPWCGLVACGLPRHPGIPGDEAIVDSHGFLGTKQHETCGDRIAALHNKCFSNGQKSSILHTADAHGGFPPSAAAAAVPLWRFFDLHTSMGFGFFREPIFLLRPSHLAFARLSVCLRVGLEKGSTISISCEASCEHADVGDCDPRFR